MGSEIVERLRDEGVRYRAEATGYKVNGYLWDEAAAHITALEAEIELLADNGCHLQAQLAALEAMCEKMAGTLEKIANRADKLRKGTDDWFELAEFSIAARETLAQYREADNGR